MNWAKGLIPEEDSEHTCFEVYRMHRSYGIDRRPLIAAPKKGRDNDEKQDGDFDKVPANQ